MQAKRKKRKYLDISWLSVDKKKIANDKAN